MGLSRGKITASHLEEEMNTEFEMSVVSNCLVSRNGPVRYQKPVKHFADFGLGRPTRLRVAVAEDIFFASKNPSKRKTMTSKTQENCSYFHRVFEIDANEIETSSEP